MKKLEEIFGIDLRALGVFRICLGFILIFDLLSRIPDFYAFYADSGMLSRESLLAGNNPPEYICLHLISGAGWAQAILLFIQGICAIGLLVGYRTTLMTVLSWVLIVSLNRRNHMVNGAGDDTLRLILFWSMFVPLGARFSLDRLLEVSRSKPPQRVLTWGSVGLLLQIAGSYWVSAANKWPLSVWQDGTAVYYALSLDNYATNFGQLLLQYPSVTNFLTHTTLWLELIGPFLLFFPFYTKVTRTLTTFAFMFLHFSFLLCMYLMLFPWVGAVSMIVFLPSEFWDRLNFTASTRWTPHLSHLRTKLSKLPAVKSPNIKMPLWMSAILILLIISVIMWNLMALKVKHFKMPQFFRSICILTDLDQAWRMFAPPPPTGGWFVIPGILQDKTEVDLFRDGAAVNWSKPAKKDMYKNERWRRVMINYVFGKNKVYWPDYGLYLCNSWNARHTGREKLDTLEIVFMAKKTPPPGENASYTKKVLLAHSCVPPVKDRSPEQKATSSEGAKNKIRPAAVAGKFYPADITRLKETVDHLITEAPSSVITGDLIAMLVPHAAYKYSGAIAAQGYKHIGKQWDAIILLGPSHKISVQGAAIWAKGSFATPLGNVAVDEILAEKLIKSTPLIQNSPVPHQNEHSLEVQMPFLQRYLGSGTKIVPLLISTTDVQKCQRLGEAIARTIRGQKVLIVISSDLVHYPNRDTAWQIDSETLGSIQKMDPLLVHDTAVRLQKQGIPSVKTTMCGQGALLTGMHAAKLLGADQALVLNYTNSGEMEFGDPQKAVGYAAVAFVGKKTAVQNRKEETILESPLDASTRAYLLAHAFKAIQESLNGNQNYSVASSNPILAQNAAVFVTLEINGKLRGCRGTTSASRKLLDGVIHFARQSAFNDSRFPPLTQEEFNNTKIKISILSTPQGISSADAITPGKHGVIVRTDNTTGLFLPSVWKRFPHKETFLDELCTQKAKLPKQCWKDPNVSLSIFSSYDFLE